MKAFSVYIFCGFVLLSVYSCSSIRVEQRVKTAEGDWLMAGGSPNQQNVSVYSLAPPLNLMWDYNVEGGVSPAGICVSDAVLFVNALQGEMFALDISTGGKIGNVKFLGKDASTAPLILGNDVILAYAGDKEYSLCSYSIYKGEINWRKNYGYIQTSPVYKDGFVYFGGLNGNQYKVDASTGTAAWKFESKAQIHSTCALWEDNVIFGNDKGVIYCLKTGDGSESWKLETTAPVNATPMTNEGFVYIGGDDSSYYCINVSNGAVLWKNNLHSKIISGSALYNKENIIATCVDGSVYSMNLSDGSINWSFRSKGTIVSSAVVSGDYVYFSSFDSHVYCLNAVNGNMLWNALLENKAKSSPVVWKDYLFTASDDIVYCFTSKPVVKSENKD